MLNCCRNNEIRDVEIDKDYAGFSINYNQYSDLEKILKENNIEIVNRQELGIYTKITNCYIYFCNFYFIINCKFSFYLENNYKRKLFLYS